MLLALPPAREAESKLTASVPQQRAIRLEMQHWPAQQQRRAPQVQVQRQAPKTQEPTLALLQVQVQVQTLTEPQVRVPALPDLQAQVQVQAQAQVQVPTLPDPQAQVQALARPVAGKIRSLGRPATAKRAEGKTLQAQRCQALA